MNECKDCPVAEAVREALKIILDYKKENNELRTLLAQIETFRMDRMKPKKEGTE